MGKGKGGANHLRARLEYLNKAATYLQSASISRQNGESTNNEQDETLKSTKIIPQIIDQSNASESAPKNETQEPKTSSQQSRLYISQMRGVSLKCQLRLPIEVKRSYCKCCDTLVVPDVNSTQEMRNESRGRKKPWADVWVVRCLTCGTEKRFPQTQKRSQKLSERKKEKGKVQKDQNYHQQKKQTTGT